MFFDRCRATIAQSMVVVKDFNVNHLAGQASSAHPALLNRSRLNRSSEKSDCDAYPFLYKVQEDSGTNRVWVMMINRKVFAIGAALLLTSTMFGQTSPQRSPAGAARPAAAQMAA